MLGCFDSQTKVMDWQNLKIVLKHILKYWNGLEKLFETRLRGILLNKKVGAILPRSAVSVALILVLLLPLVCGVEYETVEYIDGCIGVSVQISADTPWVAPFSESVSISVNVTPLASAVQ